MLISADSSSAPSFEYTEGDQTRLALRGACVVTTLSAIESELRSLVKESAPKPLVQLDLSGLERLDTAGAYLIDRTLRDLAEAAPEMIGADPAALSLLTQARDLATREEQAPPVHQEGHGFVDMLERTGRSAEHIWQETLETLSFLGGTLVAMSTIAWRPTKMRWTALVSVMEDAGLDAVPIIAFLSFFAG